jgi:triacylglycerol lipase
MYETLPPASSGSLTSESLKSLPLPEGTQWSDLGFLLVPGLLTKWYPLYMKQLRTDMKRIGLHVTFSRIDTDQPVRINAARLRHEILEMAQSGRRVVLMGHSKGAVDCAAALSLFPELVEFVAGLISLQGPHGGSAIAHDLANTELQKTIVLGALEKLLRGCKHAILDLSFESRQDFLRQHAYPLHRVPTLCVATCDKRQSSLLTPLIEYVAVRYGEVCDGLVCQGDAVLPNSVRVMIDDMDHFGPAWGTFPATDRYDPARLWLSCVSLALRFGQPRGSHTPSVCDPTRPPSRLSNGGGAS